MPFISKDFIRNKLMPRLDIVKLIQQYRTLKLSGANYKCCCPFHNEKTPSFTVSPSRQTYRCFGCGEHGNAIDFVMKYNNSSFVDAVEELARFAGIDVEYDKNSDYDPKKADMKQGLYKMMDDAAYYFTRCLQQNPEAMAYFKEKRGLSDEIIVKARLGYAPDNFEYVEQELAKNSEDYSKAVDCGLQKDIHEEGRHRKYAFFRNRVMFPIFDVKGRIIAFGGRVLGDEKTAKYLNSPETPIFKKSREIFGLYECLQANRNRPESVVVVEGYMDAIALRQAGYNNIVATLGTALTSEHIQALFRYTNEVVFCFDSDDAGKKAGWHAMQVITPLLKETEKNVRFLFLPAGHDPDTFVRAHGNDAFRDEIKKALSLTETLFLYKIKEFDLSNVDGRGDFIRNVASIIKAMPFNYQFVAKQLLSEILHMSLEEVNNTVDDPSIEIDRSFLPQPTYSSRYENSSTSQGQRGNSSQYSRSQGSTSQRGGYEHGSRSSGAQGQWQGRFANGGQGGYNNGGYGGYNNTRQGDYSSNGRGGYGDQDGYNNARKGGYSSNGRGGYGDQDGYNNARKGGYSSNGRGGYGGQDGYNNDRQGGYSNARQDGYSNNRQGGYGSRGQGRYSNSRQDGYSNSRQGGYGNDSQGGYNRSHDGHHSDGQGSWQSRSGNGSYGNGGYGNGQASKPSFGMANGNLAGSTDLRDFDRGQFGGAPHYDDVPSAPSSFYEGSAESYNPWPESRSNSNERLIRYEKPQDTFSYDNQEHGADSNHAANAGGYQVNTYSKGVQSISVDQFRDQLYMQNAERTLNSPAGDYMNLGPDGSPMSNDHLNNGGDDYNGEYYEGGRGPNGNLQERQDAWESKWGPSSNLAMSSGDGASGSVDIEALKRQGIIDPYFHEPVSKNKGLYSHEIVTYQTVVGRDFSVSEASGPFYEMLAFVLQQPTIVATLYDFFNLDEFLAIAKELKFIEYPCLERLFELIKHERTITCALLIEEFRDTQFWSLFNYLFDLPVLPAKADGAEMTPEAKSEHFVKYIIECLKTPFLTRLSKLQPNSNEDLEESMALDEMKLLTYTIKSHP